MELYDTHDLVGVIEVQKPFEGYFLKYFPSVMMFDTQDIIWDMIAPSRVLAPFVAPNVQGRVMRRRGYTSKVFRPAYVKPKHTVDPSMVIPRMAGEALATGSLSREQRYAAIVGENMRVEVDMIDRRLEWMAAKALIDGQVTVVGDDMPPRTVIFGRDASLSATLLTTQRWSQATGKPLDDIALMQRNSFRLANGTTTRLTFGLNAWGSFSTNPQVTPLLSTLVRGSDTTFSQLGPTGVPYQYMGYLAGYGAVGRIDLYTFSDQYEDDAGVLQDFLNTDTVVGTGEGLMGVQAFGGIFDLEHLMAAKYWPKMWLDNDPSVAYTMTQSAPLVVPAQPNASWRLIVN